MRLFKRVVQSLIELWSSGERSPREGIGDHTAVMGAFPEQGAVLPVGDDAEDE